MARETKGKSDKIRPRIGHWAVAANGEVTLLASRCDECGEGFFPAHEICGRCGGEKLSELKLHAPAILRSYTIVHQLPAGFTGPLAVGYGEFPGQVLVLAPIDAAPGSLRGGMTLGLRVGVTRIDEDGEPMESYRFTVAGGEGVV